MVSIKLFTFNPFQENTYVLHDETGECIIIDPGCYDANEQQLLTSYIMQNKLKPVQLINTHCHVDHVFGNKFIHEQYSLLPVIHKADLGVLDSLTRVADMYGLRAEASPLPVKYIDEGDVVTFGKSSLDVVFTPGHCPGEVCLISHTQKFVIAGDVLFYGSIGRTDLPSGDHDTLINSIKSKLMVLADDYVVYSGHGPSTNIGFERNNNPFL